MCKHIESDGHTLDQGQIEARAEAQPDDETSRTIMAADVADELLAAMKQTPEALAASADGLENNRKLRSYDRPKKLVKCHEMLFD